MTEPIDPEGMRWLTDQVGRLIIAATDRDPETAVTVLTDVGERYRADGMYGVCCALAATVHTLAFPSIDQGDGSLTGDMIAIQKIGDSPGDPHSLWAARFVAAYINGDADTTTSLFYGSIGDEERHTGGVIALVGMVGGIARQVAAERRTS